jgi:hypothetical protein
MSEEHHVRTKSGKFYIIKVSTEKYYISKPGRGSIASAKSMADALAIIENDSGEKIASVS